MSNERRIDPRVNHYFDCRWHGQWGTTDARLNDLSSTGCHVVNRFTTPAVGEIVEIEILGTAQGPITLSGEVMSVERGIGFGVKFSDLDDDARARIEALMDAAEQSNRRVGS
jgi:hypothetical protein